MRKTNTEQALRPNPGTDKLEQKAPEDVERVNFTLRPVKCFVLLARSTAPGCALVSNLSLDKVTGHWASLNKTTQVAYRPK